MAMEAVVVVVVPEAVVVVAAVAAVVAVATQIAMGPAIPAASQAVAAVPVCYELYWTTLNQFLVLFKEHFTFFFVFDTCLVPQAAVVISNWTTFFIVRVFCYGSPTQKYLALCTQLSPLQWWLLC